MVERKTVRTGRKSHLVTIGLREIETHGLGTGFWSDLYYRSMTVHWPGFFGSAALIFIVLNTVFAFLFWLGNSPIANVAPDLPLPLSLFYFSIETLATVGYGDMHPQTNYGHLVATIEIFTGMTFLAVMTGLIFARFSRPRTHFVFARHPVVTTYQGVPTLMIRIANARHNTISQATAQLWVFKLLQTQEGEELRRFYELKLDRCEHPMFSLSWTLLHIVDETSPIFGMTQDDFVDADGALVVNVGGVDDNSAQRSMLGSSMRGATSAGSIVTATSPGIRRTVGCCSTTQNFMTLSQSNPDQGEIASFCPIIERQQHNFTHLLENLLLAVREHRSRADLRRG